MEELKKQLELIRSHQDELLTTLVRLSSQNSGTYNIQGIDASLKILDEFLLPLGAKKQIIPLEKFTQYDEKGVRTDSDVGSAIVYSQRENLDKKILFSGHIDTVYPVSSSFQKVIKEGDLLKGPGVADMKGGLLVMGEALKAFECLSVSRHVGWRFIISPDEEIGSPCSRSILQTLAKDSLVGLIAEPRLPCGSLAKTRKGSSNFSVFIRGKEAHVGRAFCEGRSAIVALGLLIQKLHEGNNIEGIIVNVGKVLGGVARNVVPGFASCQVNVRSDVTFDVLQWVHDILDQVSSLTGCQLSLENWLYRPLKSCTSQIESLYLIFKKAASDLGHPILNWKDTGGVCDGNILADCGLPTLDSLGVLGGEIHSENEFMKISSLVDHAQLLLCVLERLASKNLVL